MWSNLVGSLLCESSFWKIWYFRVHKKKTKLLSIISGKSQLMSRKLSWETFYAQFSERLEFILRLILWILFKKSAIYNQKSRANFRLRNTKSSNGQKLLGRKIFTTQKLKNKWTGSFLLLSIAFENPLKI